MRHWRLPTRASARAYEYEPYGNPYAGSGFFTLPRIHALHEFDTAIRQYRAPWRDYSPAMARWTTPDPLGMVDGPNVFAYVKGNPVNAFDILGLRKKPEETDCQKFYLQCLKDVADLRNELLGNFSGQATVDAICISACATLGEIARRRPSPLTLLAAGGSCLACLGVGAWALSSIIDALQRARQAEQNCQDMYDACICRAV